MRIVSFDLETWLFSPGQRAPKPVIAGVYEGPGFQPKAMLIPEFATWLKTNLLDPEVVFVNQNIAYDFAVVCAHCPELTNDVFRAYAENRVGCTMLLAQLHDIAVYGTNKGGKIRLDDNYEDWDLDDPETLSEEQIDAKENPTRYIHLGYYNLQSLAKRFLGIFLDKDEWRMRYAELDGLSLEEFPAGSLDYVKGDAVAAYGVWQKIQESAKKRKVPLDNIWAQTRGQFGLFLATCGGLYTDPVYVKQLRSEAQKFRDDSRSKLLEHGLIRPDQGQVIWEYHTKTTGCAEAKREYLRRRGLKNNNAQTRSNETRPVTRRILDVLGRRGQQKTIEAVGPAMWHILHRLGLWKTTIVRRNSGRRWPCDKYIASDAAARDYAEGVDARLKIKLPRTPKGSIKLNPETIQLVDDDLLEMYVEWKRTSSVMAEIERLSKGISVPIHAEYRTLKETGRTSSGGGEAGINIQNRRRAPGYREVFIPETGCALVSIDYSQIELCALAQVQYDWFGKSSMRDTINAGRDCHVIVAAKLMDISYEEADQLKKQGDKRLKQMRTLAKALNFGLPGGLGETKFRQFAKQTYKVDVLASQWSVTPKDDYVPLTQELCPTSLFIESLPTDLQEKAETDIYINRRGDEKKVVFDSPDGTRRVPTWWMFEQAATNKIFVLKHSFAHLRSEWFKIYPEKPLYFDKVKQLRSENGNKITQHKTGRVRARTTYCSASNSFFQGLVADGAKEAVFRLQRAAFTTDWGPDVLRGCPVRIFVHDECVLQVPLERLHISSYAASELMVNTMKEFIPDVLIEATPAAMRRWTKLADDARHDSKGHLIPEEDFRLQQDWVPEEEKQDYRAFFARHKLKVKPL